MTMIKTVFFLLSSFNKFLLQITSLWVFAGTHLVIF